MIACNAKTFAKVYERIQLIARDVVSKHAGACDAQKRFPLESLEALRDADLQSILVPKEFGGWGLNFTQYQHCLAKLGEHCASTASAFNMHNIVVGSVSQYNLSVLSSVQQDKVKSRLMQFFDLVVNKKYYIAAATTEPGIGARFSQVKTSYQLDNGSWLLNGTKSFVTMSHFADYYLVLANKSSANGEVPSGHWLTYFLVPRMAAGVTIEDDWDVLGMRGTDSNQVYFDQVRLSPDAVFMGNVGFALAKVMSEPQWVTGGYLGVYLGLMRAIYDFCRRYVTERSDYSQQSGLAYYPLLQARLGQMYALLNSAELNVFHAAQTVDEDPKSLKMQQAVYAAKYFISQSVPQLALLALRTCGGTAIHKRFPLERYLRDGCCGGLMPAVSDVCELFLGKKALDLDCIDLW